MTKALRKLVSAASTNDPSPQVGSTIVRGARPREIKSSTTRLASDVGVWKSPNSMRSEGAII
jgi:hypothetical protein